MDNRSKAVLDDVALKMQQDPNLNAVLSGSAEPGEPRSMALQRAQNAMDLSDKSKGIDASASRRRPSTEPGRKVEVWTLPAGADVAWSTRRQAPRRRVIQQPGPCRQRPFRNLRHRNFSPRFRKIHIFGHSAGCALFSLVRVQ